MKTIKVMRDGRPATKEELQCAVEGKPLPPLTGSAYQAAWMEQENQWKRIREWEKRQPKNFRKPTKRTHLMDFASGWSAAIRAAYESVGRLSG